MKSVSAILIGLFCIEISLYSQGEINDQEEIFYRNERTYALSLNSTGYGGNFRYAKRYDAFKKTLYELELSLVKHEKELKLTNLSSQQFGASYVFGKLNTFVTLRAGIGFQKELFSKRDRGGISIRYFYNFGPVIGFLKPIYYNVRVMEDSITVLKTMKYEEHILYIDRKAPFYIGLEETKIVPGIYGKLGVTFEFGKSDKGFRAIETGIALDAFAKRIEIMAKNKDHFLFFSFFLSYRFGKVIDAQFKNKRTKVDEMLVE